MWSTVPEFVAAFKAAGIKRCCITFNKETGVLEPSHPFLQPLVDFLTNDPIDFYRHEGLFLELGPEDTLMGAFCWWTNRGQAAGGVRFRPYSTFEEYIRDGIRLALGMGRKNALAGLWWGGGKGVCAHPPGDLHKDPEFRGKLFRSYGQFLTSLHGLYVSAEDSGVTVTDVNTMFSKTRFTTCISEELGGSGNPSILTAEGIVCAMEAALEFLGMGSLEGKTIAVQGVGQVGFPLVKYLLAKNVARIIAAESSQDRIDQVRGELDERVDLRLTQIGNNEILATEADIVSPNAWGGVLNENTIPTIKAKIVCGAANNQLQKSSDDNLMKKQGICYVPDFVANRMGIVNCANEQYGALVQDPFKTRHFDKSWDEGIHRVVLRVLETAKATGESNNTTAEKLADEAAMKDHPIFPRRNYSIVREVAAEWKQ